MSYLRVQEIEILGPAGKAGVPIGHPYLQLPGMPEPSTIYTGTWENVSADYAGDFFRVEGGEALAFDPNNLTEQLDQMQKITGETYLGQGNGAGPGINLLNGTYSGAISLTKTNSNDYSQILGFASANYTKDIKFDSSGSPDARTSSTTDGETRPVNRTIRIWKRIS